MDDTSYIILIAAEIIVPGAIVLGVLWYWLHTIRVRMSLNMHDIYRSVLSLDDRMTKIEKRMEKKCGF